jgi:hypothetical protein
MSAPAQDIPAARELAETLLNAAAVRSRCRLVFEAGRHDALTHFRLDLDKLPATADFVLDTMRAAYPTLAIPYHSRWRHFGVGGLDRWAKLAPKTAADAREQLRVQFELAITSVLLDAGAGPHWRYREAAGGEYARSEGLAVASFHLFASGAFSSASHTPLRADADGLADFTEDKLAAAFQIGADNPLEGLAGRAALMRRLGEAVRTQPAIFGAQRPRLGTLADHMIGLSKEGVLPATTILEALLVALGPIWPGRITLGGVSLGDVWRHRQVRTGDATDCLVPLHKLSQWLSYSLVEPLEQAGIRVSGLDGLTGLAEYRNGGLFIDSGVIAPRDPNLLRDALPPDAEAVVEWRALTVILLDEIAVPIRTTLGLDPVSLPLAKVLEGGTWAAGRRIARDKRADGTPPLNIISDGTVF